MITTLRAAMAECAKYKAAGLTRYNVITGKCGDWYIVPLDEMGRLV